MKLQRSLVATCAVSALVLVSALLMPGRAAAGPNSCEVRPNDTYAKLLECVTLDGVRRHQAALQAIADVNGGTRAAGTTGYDQSYQYIVDKLSAAGYVVTLNPFAFVYVPPALLQQITPFAATYETGAYTGTGYGDVTGSVYPVDINPGFTSTSGCEAADFAGFPAGSVALIQRGTCNFSVKALNAEAAGAAAVIIFNDGVTPDRQGLIVGTLGGTDVVGIPVVGASFNTGLEFALSAIPPTVRIKVDEPQNVTQYNVIAESRAGDPTNVVMVGAHLDSVRAGPGINDNGSGSAAILEVALQMARVRPRNKLRFAWWGAEEAGLIGSTAYVAGLSDAEKDRIALYLNFDMIGSPNHVFFVLDGDDSDGVGNGAGPEGSAAIEKVFETYYTLAGVPFRGSDLSGRSDYGPFIAAGIPSGGLFTGAEGIKTAEEQSIWGGTAGEQFDPCYHLACDTYDNVNLYALGVNVHAVAFAVLTHTIRNQSGRARRGPFQYQPEFWGPRATR